MNTNDDFLFATMNDINSLYTSAPFWITSLNNKIKLITAHGLSWFLSVLVITTGKYASDQGTGKLTSNGISTTGLAAAVLIGLSCIAACFVTEAAVFAQQIKAPFWPQCKTRTL